jgi:hypothetical protein
MTAVELRDDLVATRRAAARGLRAFYSRPVGWLALGVTSTFLAYGGGGVMFWFHAVYRGEEGPPINHWWHWLFDSSLGFVALTPALFFILPGALWAVKRAGVRSGPTLTAAYVVVVGALFGVVTGPGPFLHNSLVGRDAPLGRLAVRVFGTDPSVVQAPAVHSTLSESMLQVALGVPTYAAAGLLALMVVRALAIRRRETLPL